EKWTSSNTAVATVDQYGWVTPVAAGTCTVTVQSVNNPNVKADIKVTVTNPNAPTVSAISLTKTTMNLYAGSYADISYVTMLPSTLPESAKGEIWTSSNTAVATVDEYGWVYPVAPGTCTVTVKSANNPSVSANITVYVYQKKK
ncbi:MAG: Ig-like domain-containing protein, partial [Ruminococcus sp.]|nr:Ig-like domain-containing protein [Ruminococcus sp.]